MSSFGIREDWPGFATQIGVAADFSRNIDRGTWTGPFAATPDGECTLCSYVDIFFRNGLGEYDNALNILPRTVVLEVQWRDRELKGPWITIPVGDTSFSTEDIDRAADQRGHSIKIQYPDQTVPEVRIRRVTEDSNSTQIFDVAEWSGLRSVLPSPDSYPEATVVTIESIGTNTFGRNAEQLYNCIARRRLPTLVDYCTKDNQIIEDSSRYEFTDSPIIAVIYSALRTGYSLDIFNLDDLKECDAYFDTMEYTFNAEVAEDINLFDLMQRILAVGFSAPSPICGEITVVHDRAEDATLGQLYTSQDTLGGFTRSLVHYDSNRDAQRSGIITEYFDNELSKPDDVECFLPGDDGSRPLRTRAFGVTDRDHAYRYGIRQRRRERYLPMQITWNTGLSGLNSYYGDIAFIADDLCGNAPGFVESYDPETLRITTSEPARGPFAYISERDGSISAIYNVTVIGYNELQLDRQIQFRNNCAEEKPRIAMGLMEDLATKVRIINVDPSVDDTVSITAEEYRPEIYLEDRATAPEKQSRC